jgi:hypothetical protein
VCWGGVEVQVHAFLTSALDGSDCSALHPGRFSPGTHWIGGWAGRKSEIFIKVGRSTPRLGDIQLSLMTSLPFSRTICTIRVHLLRLPHLLPPLHAELPSKYIPHLLFVFLRLFEFSATVLIFSPYRTVYIVTGPGFRN